MGDQLFGAEHYIGLDQTLASVDGQHHYRNHQNTQGLSLTSEVYLVMK